MARASDASDDHLESEAFLTPLQNRAVHQLDHEQILPTHWSLRDFLNLVLVFFLFFVTGIPPSLIGGTFAAVFQDRLSYGQVGLFSIAFSAYTVQLLWSPIIDSFWISSFGRRKSWLVPCLLFAAVVLFVVGIAMDHIQHTISKSSSTLALLIVASTLFTIAVSMLTVASNGWSLSVFSSSKYPYVSMVHSLGEISGFFSSYPLFLALNSPTWSKLLGGGSEDTGPLSLGTFMIWNSVYFACLGLFVIFFLSDAAGPLRKEGSIRRAYRTTYRVFCLRPVQLLFVVHLLARIGFEANDGATVLKLLEKGFPQSDYAVVSTITTAFELLLGFLAGRWCTQYHSLDVWCVAFMARAAAAFVAPMLIWLFPTKEIGWVYLVTVCLTDMLNGCAMTVSMVAMMAWHYHIAQKDIGGSYIALLATSQNLGEIVPRFFVMRAIDMFTISRCPSAVTQDGTSATTSAVPNGSDRCVVLVDGYYIVNVLCLVVGILAFLLFMRPTLQRLKKLPGQAWTVDME